jgi:hypothetical protein
MTDSAAAKISGLRMASTRALARDASRNSSRHVMLTPAIDRRYAPNFLARELRRATPSDQLTVVVRTLPRVSNQIAPDHAAGQDCQLSVTMRDDASSDSDAWMPVAPTTLNLRPPSPIPASSWAAAKGGRGILDIDSHHLAVYAGEVETWKPNRAYRAGDVIAVRGLYPSFLNFPAGADFYVFYEADRDFTSGATIPLFGESADFEDRSYSANVTDGGESDVWLSMNYNSGHVRAFVWDGSGPLDVVLFTPECALQVGSTGSAAFSFSTFDIRTSFGIVRPVAEDRFEVWALPYARSLRFTSGISTLESNVFGSSSRIYDAGAAGSEGQGRSRGAIWTRGSFGDGNNPGTVITLPVNKNLTDGLRVNIVGTIGIRTNRGMRLQYGLELDNGQSFGTAWPREQGGSESILMTWSRTLGQWMRENT